MKFQIADFGFRICSLVFIICLAVTDLSLADPIVNGRVHVSDANSQSATRNPQSNAWQGVDESVVEKYAKEHGREAHQPLINTDQGDLLLFVFLVAGTIGGFVAGYYWRKLTESKQSEPGKGEKQ